MNSNPQKAERQPCNLCGSQSAEFLYPKLGMIRCADCGLVRADTIPTRDEVERLYSEKYFRSSDSGALGYDDYAADRKNICRTFDKRMDEIEGRLGRKGRLLDVGCALGFSLEVAKRRGWEPRGVEISSFACEHARRELDLEVFCGPLGETEFAPGGFDVVTMWDYLEHSPDPAGELKQVHGLLKKDGLLALTTPNIASLPARIWRSRWMGIKQEEHLYYFSRETIEKLLSKCGFRAVQIKHVGKYIDVDFFIKRTGLYSKGVERTLARLARALGVGESMLYVNPFDIMIVYAEKTGATE